MKIVRIAKQEHRDRYNLFTEDGYVGSVAAGTLLDSDLKAGVEVSDAALQALTAQDQSSRALAKAYDYLARRPHSVGELRRKLTQKEFGPEDIEQVIARLLDHGYLDDRAFAQQWITERGATRGPHLLRQELMKKDLPREVVDEALAETAPESDLQTLIQARAQRYGEQDWSKLRDKIARYLVSRGYSYDEINAALQEYQTNES